MPREFRKRGRKNKKSPEDQIPQPVDDHSGQLSNVEQPGQPSQPSWIISGPGLQEEESNAEAPFGYVDAEVKAYFRTVDVQIRQWQDNEGDRDEVEQDIDPNEAKRLFFVAALTEMSGKEKLLATDPDCSFILERMSYSMDDFVRRVFVDSLAGSYELLVKHRFASHVCQTLITVAADTTSRECRGVVPSIPESSDRGELRTLTQLIIDVCDELLPSLTSLIMDPFASHVIRAILLLLSPRSASSDPSSSTLRSKKSAAWKARQGPMKSVFADDKITTNDTSSRITPAEFRGVARKFVEAVRTELDENEVRSFAANKVASPVLQILLEVEAEEGMSSTPGSLMDRVTVGIITATSHDPNTPTEPSDYVNTLLRDPTSSHLLETVVRRAPDSAFFTLWNTYFRGRLVRLAGHPVANFVVAKTLERTSGELLSEACIELESSWGKMINSSRTGILRAIIDRAAVLHSVEQEVCKAIRLAFNLSTSEDNKLLLPCVLRLKTLQDYQSALISTREEPPNASKQHSRRDAKDDPMEPKIQGAVLLQSLLRLAAPHNQIVIDSINSLSVEELLVVAQNPMSSRVLDALLESPTVPIKTKRQFVISFIGYFHRLVDDRIGSRVGDRCWAFADTYLKEKIARSLIPYEQTLAGSFYGKFFARNLNLYILQRRPDEWKTMQSERTRTSVSTRTSALNGKPEPPTCAPLDTKGIHKKRKRDATRQEDEIDAVFSAAFGKKAKKGALAPESDSTSDKLAISSTENAPNREMNNVLDAIRSAPKGKEHGKKKRTS